MLDVRAQQKQGFGAFAARYAERDAERAAARGRAAEPVPGSADAPTYDTPEPRVAPEEASPARGPR